MAVNLMAAQLQLQVPGATVIPPSIWTPSPAYRDTLTTLPSAKLGVVIHYPGIISGNWSPIHDAAEAARRIQANYRSSRGYDIGYNYLVDQAGRIAIGRGRYRSASQGTTTANGNYLGINILVDPDEGLNAFNVLSVQRLIHTLRTQWRYGNTILGHKNVNSTSCPGDQIYAWLIAGGFEPKPETWPENAFNPWEGRYGGLIEATKPLVVPGMRDNYVVEYLQGVLINEFAQVIDPAEKSDFGWATVSAVHNMKTWFNATKPAGAPPMDTSHFNVGEYEWRYVDWAARGLPV